MSCQNNENLYAQGIYDFNFYDLTTDELLFQSRTITEGNIATSVNLNEIRGGIGNAIQIQIPSDASLTVTMTAANFSLEGLALNTGSTIMPNGTYYLREQTTLVAGTGENAEKVVGKVLSTPVAPIGSVTGDIIGYVDCTTKVIIDPETKEFVVEGGEVGDTVCIEYYTQTASAEIFRIGSNFAPKIGRAVLRTPLYTTNGQGGSGSILAGELQIVIPKAQLNGDLNLDLSQSANATTVLNMTALADYETKPGECPTNDGTLGYIIKIVNETTVWDRIDRIVVLGGGISLANGETETIVVKGVSDSNPNLLENVPYDELTFTSGSDAIATVDATGLVTAKSQGDTEITIKNEEKNFTVTCDVEVTP